MKKLVYILTFFILAGTAAQAQDDGADDRIRDKMREYIQQRIGLSRNESEKFTPVFVRYFKEWRTTLRDFRGGDKLVLQQKIIELKLRYRPEFKDALGDKRSNEVYRQQDNFIRDLENIRRDRIKERLNDRPPVKRQ